MKLLFKQRFFCLLDNYDIYDEKGSPVYVVEGQLTLGHCFKIYDTRGNRVGMVKQRLFALLPKFEMYMADRYVGCISREFTFFTPRYNIDCNGWQVEGDIFEWDYSICSASGQRIATVSKELLNWTDTYSIDVANPADALCALMLVIAIDAEKCSRDN